MRANARVYTLRVRHTRLTSIFTSTIFRSVLKKNSVVLNCKPRIICPSHTRITMASIDTYLECLKAKLGDEAYLLQHAPYEKVEMTELFGEIKATSFKILLGYIRARPDNGAAEDTSEHLEDEDDMPVRKKQKVWMYMYPAQNSYCSPEIQLHAYGLNGGYISKLDSENISKVISGFAPAFKLLGRHKWTKAKLIALAKYYFLRKLADSNNARDRELLQYGVNISNAFKDDLVSVCRNFQDMDKRASMKAVPVIVLDQESNQGSTLSEVSGGLHKEHSSPDSTSIKEEPVIQSKVVATYPHVTSTVS
jgi:hypothetical protein